MAEGVSKRCSDSPASPAEVENASLSTASRTIGGIVSAVIAAARPTIRSGTSRSPSKAAGCAAPVK